MPDGQENIPHLLNELIPQATFFSQVVNRGILGHYVATASIVTGAYETFNNFAAVSPDNPTVFEYFRKDLKRPGDRLLGGGAQQRLRADRRERASGIRSRARRGRDPSEAPAFGRALGGGRRRALSAPAARQLRNAAIRADADRPRNWN